MNELPEQQTIDSHPRFSPTDEVTVNKSVIVYEIVAAYRDGTVMLREADSERQRKRTVNTDSATLHDVELSEQTKAKRAEQERERRVKAATDWANSFVKSFRDEQTKLRERFDDRTARDVLWDEYAASTLVDYQIATEIVECIDAEIKELAESEIVEPVWETLITVATYQLSYGRGSLNSSEPTHRARAQQLHQHWVKVLTQAITMKAHAEGDKRRRRY